MTATARKIFALLLLAGACTGLSPPAGAEPDAATKEALAKATQNPVADLISLPFQDNINFSTTPQSLTQNVLNIQPVIPIELSSDWNLVTRTILPVISQGLYNTPGPGNATNGIGDLQFSTFLSPANSSGWIWGVGTIVQAPTASDEALGQGKWGIGPTAVALHLTRNSSWVYGALINNVSSFAGSSNRQAVNQMLIQPFLNYNVPGRPGMAVGYSPIITANWEATGSNQWTVPLGLQISQVLFAGNQALSIQLGAYDNVVRPQYAATWTARVQVSFLFPKSK